jgi:hypothetical protein
LSRIGSLANPQAVSDKLRAELSAIVEGADDTSITSIPVDVDGILTGDLSPVDEVYAGDTPTVPTTPENLTTHQDTDTVKKAPRYSLLGVRRQSTTTHRRSSISEIMSQPMIANTMVLPKELPHDCPAEFATDKD